MTRHGTPNIRYPPGNDQEQPKTSDRQAPRALRMRHKAALLETLDDLSTRREALMPCPLQQAQTVCQEGA